MTETRRTLKSPRLSKYMGQSFENIHRYLQQQNQAKLIAKNKTRQNLLQKSSIIGTCLKYSHIHKILASPQKVSACSEYMRFPKMYAFSQNICICSKYMRMFKIYAHIQNICTQAVRNCKIAAPHNIR